MTESQQVAIHYEATKLIAKINECLIADVPLKIVRTGDLAVLLKCIDGIDGYNMEWFYKRYTSWAKIKKHDNLFDYDYLNRYKTNYINACKDADILGVFKPNDKYILAHETYKYPMVTSVLSHYGIIPKFTCDAALSRYILMNKSFRDLLSKNDYIFATNQGHYNKYARYCSNNNIPLLSKCHFIMQSDYNDIPTTIASLASSNAKLILLCVGIWKYQMMSNIPRTNKVIFDVGQLNHADHQPPEEIKK